MRSNSTAPSTDLFDQAFAIALQRWTIALGSTAVLHDERSCKYYQRDCGTPGKQVRAALMPTSREQVQQIIVIATETGIPLYPISKGCNWGYGTRNPAVDGCVIVDLSRMNRIVTINEELAYALVEPGVSQGQLFRELEKRGLLMADVTGSSPEASLIGNILERGYGLTPLFDHFHQSCGMEIVCGDGSVVHTGFAALATDDNRHAYKWGFGPSLDGLFTQSNFGIVTQIGVYLTPRPESVGALLLHFDDDQALAKAAAPMRNLRLRGLLKGALHLANDVRVISSCQQSPQPQLNRQALSDSALAELRSRWKISRWTGVGGLWGSPRVIRAELKEIRQTLKGYCRVEYVPEGITNFFARFPKIYEFLMGHPLAPKLSLFKLLRGMPNEGPTLGAYWRSRIKAPNVNRDPAADNCGLLWCSPIIPLTTKDVNKLLSILRSFMAEAGFEVNLTLSVVSERAACATIAIAFDSALAGESTRALMCRTQLLKIFLSEGYPPYRGGADPATAQLVNNERRDDWNHIVRQLKHALDPAGIISPGRYGIFS